LIAEEPKFVTVPAAFVTVQITLDQIFPAILPNHSPLLTQFPTAEPIFPTVQTAEAPTFVAVFTAEVPILTAVSVTDVVTLTALSATFPTALTAP
jgi:hypothetical protein